MYLKVASEPAHISPLALFKATQPIREDSKEEGDIFCQIQSVATSSTVLLKQR